MWSAAATRKQVWSGTATRKHEPATSSVRTHGCPPRLKPLEVTCTREVGHVVHVIPVHELDEDKGSSCPVCHAGVLELRETLEPEGCDDAVQSGVSDSRSRRSKLA